MRDRTFILALLTGSLVIGGCASMQKNNDKEGEEKDEVKMSFADVPAPVQATLRRESNGARIDKVDKETDDGKTIYEADVMMSGTNWELKVDETGKLVSKKVDNEEGEKASEKKGEEKEDDEKNEKK